MPSYGQTVTLQFVAWDTSANVGKTGDSANFTLKWIKDGTSASPTNSASEVDATNAPGVYKIVMTGTEAQCQVGTICGKSSTANISILPFTCTFENLPTAAPAASGGLPTVGTGSGQISPSSGGVDVQTIKTQAVTAAAPVTFPASIGTSTYSGSDTAGTTTLLTRIPGAITLNAGMVEADLQTIKGQAVTAAAPVTFPGSIQATTTFPANFSSLAIDTNGRAKIQGGLTKGSSITMMFYMALATDHVSPATGKSVTATVSLDGGTFGGTVNSSAEVANGWYKITLAPGDTNGDTMALSFAAPSCDTTQATFIMQP